MISDRLNATLEVKTSDPDQKRRAKLLNILLLGIFSITMIALFSNVLLYITGQSLPDDNYIFIFAVFAMMTAVGIIYLINRYYSSTIASILFLAFFTLILYFSAPPFETVWGRNMIMLAIPIIMASVILRPTSSFVVAGIVAIMFVVTASQNNFPLNYVGVLANFAIALVAWLSANTLEKALAELREINLDLDAKVEERTKELVLANQQLAEAKDAAVEANQYKTELTARVSHELRTPLGAILGFAEMLSGGYLGEVNDKQKQKLQSIIQTTEKLSALISDWLDQAKLESGKLELKEEWFEIRSMVAYVEDITQVLLKGKSLSLNFEVDDNVPFRLYGDSVRIQQIIVNLVSNAIKYTNRGMVNVSVLFKETYWIIRVEDTGVGIPANALPTIFDSFKQVDGTRTRKHEGFGLGLSIVKHLVELMEGDIYVESTPYEGSVFSVELPIQQEKTRMSPKELA